MKFPENFLWGGAVAANQCEGAPGHPAARHEDAAD